MKRLVKRISYWCLGWCMMSCEPNTLLVVNDEELAHAWADMALYITRYTPSNSPTFASRCLGYIGLTMYESIVPGFDSLKSLNGQLNGLDNLPLINDRDEYNWPMSLNAAQAQIIRKLYIQTDELNKAKIDSLENSWERRLRPHTSNKVVERSIQFGKSVADSIFSWSLSDGGHRGYLKNFDKTKTYPQVPGGWKPPLYAQSFSHYPLHPDWGSNRTFVMANSSLDTPLMIKYDTLVHSPYYKQYLQVYEKEKELTQSEKEIAIYWSDDPDVTFTPGGHSYYLTTRILKETKANMIYSAMAYARTGLAIADAFINCWRWKYIFFSERPNTYVTDHIDKNWESFWPDPPFPAFPSGHAFQAGAASAVWLDMFENKVAIWDSAHVGRPKDELRNTEFKPRYFDSLSMIAKEIAISRFFGGIHTNQDNQRGLEEGIRIGEAINRLRWRTK